MPISPFDGVFSSCTVGFYLPAPSLALFARFLLFDKRKRRIFDFSSANADNRRKKHEKSKKTVRKTIVQAKKQKKKAKKRTKKVDLLGGYGTAEGKNGRRITKKSKENRKKENQTPKNRAQGAADALKGEKYEKRGKKEPKTVKKQ